MTPLQTAQLASALLVVFTPWIVVRIVGGVARSHARAVGHPIALTGLGAWLGRATVAAALLIGVVALAGVTPAPGLSLIAGVAFTALSAVALHQLGEIDRLTRPAREVDASARSASLGVRRASQYLPWRWRLGTYGLAMAGVAGFLVRLSAPADGRRWLVPVTLAAASIVFLWLYDTWIREIITGGIVSDEREAPELRRRVIRRIFAMEVLLVVGCLGAAHALVDVNWRSDGAFGSAISLSAGVLGIAGCALALSSGLLRRAYAPAPENPGRQGAELR